MDAIDGISRQRPVRDELMAIGTALVAFHGYARQGRTDRMSRILAHIQARAARAEGWRGVPSPPSTVVSTRK